MATSKKYNCLLFIIALLLPLLLQGQKPFTKTYTAADGILGVECYRVYTDPFDGLLYVLTLDNKLLRYDGQHFEKIELGREIHPLYGEYFNLDSLGFWWFSVDRKTIDFIDKNGEIATFKSAEALHPLTNVDENGHISRQQFMDEQGHIYSFEQATQQFTSTGQLSFTLPNGEEPFHQYHLYRFSDLAPVLYHVHGKNLSNCAIDIYQVVKSDSTTQLYATDYSIFHPLDKRTWLTVSKKQPDTFFITQDSIAKPVFIPGKKAPQLLKTYPWVTLYSNLMGDMYLSLPEEDQDGNQISRIWKIDPTGKASLSFSTAIEISDQGEYHFGGHHWFPSHQGLSKVNPAILEFSSTQAEMVRSLHSISEDNEGNIWFGGYGRQGFSVYDGSELKKQEDAITNTSSILPGFLSTSDALYHFSGPPNRILRYQGGQWQAIPTENTIGRDFTGYYFARLANNKIALGLNNVGLAIVDSIEQDNNLWKIIGKEKGIGLENVLHIAEDKNQRLWMGRTSRGVACYDPKLDTAKTWYRSKENPTSFGSISASIDAQDNLWLGTNVGLRLLRKVSEQDFLQIDLFEETEYIPLPGGDESLIGFSQLYDNYLVLGTQKAIHFLDLSYFYQHPQKPPKTYSLVYGEDINGSGSEQNAVLIDSKGYLWVGTQLGAARIDMDKIKFDTTATRIHLDQLIVGDESISIGNKSTLRLPLGKRNVKLSYDAQHSPYLYNNNYFNYLVTRQEGDTILSVKHTQDRSFAINYLPPDRYFIEIMAIKNNIIADHKKVQLIVPKTIVEHNLFWVLLVLSFCGIISLTYRNRVVARRKLMEQEISLQKATIEKDKLQIQSIAGSLNPHFINNSLHWIASRYRKDDKLTSMMSSLADNIEVVFKYTRSGKAYYSIAEEIQLVQNYLNICQKRFGEKEGIQVIMPPEAILNKWAKHPILIMQFQIHVENAIEHGIRNRKEASTIKIDFQETEDYLIISIEDDGTGRPMAAEMKSHGTQQGTKMLSNLISIYNSYNELPIKSRYEDLIFTDPATHKKYGTRVIIELPKTYRYDIE